MRRARPAQDALLAIAREDPSTTLATVRRLEMPARHEVRAADVQARRLGAVLALAHERDLRDFASFLLLEQLGPRTLQSLALVAEVVHGTPTRFEDPARFSFAHGGKDGHPFPVPLRVYDESIAVLRKALDAARLGHTDKLDGMARLDAFTRGIERRHDPHADVDATIAHERAISPGSGRPYRARRPSGASPAGHIRTRPALAVPEVAAAAALVLRLLELSAEVHMDSPRQVADGVWMLRTFLVNVFFVRLDDGWMLVDAGMARSAPAIRRAATELFGSVPPRAIVLTHGHFDHVGALPRLLDAWDVPLYAHSFELPHLTGRLPYPPADPTVGGGLVAWSSFLFPRGPSNFGSRLLALPKDGRVPVAPDWVALHTPGHTAGHISLFRVADGVVIAGDAVTTTQQESLISVATQRLELNGPPAYFTIDWDAARWSVQRLAATRVETLLSGHGQPMTGESMRRDLRDLAERFDERARPRRGRYVEYDAGEAAFERRWLRPLTAALLAAAGSALVFRFLSDAGRTRLSRAH